MSRAVLKIFFSCGRCWGIYHQRLLSDGNWDRGLEILYGDSSVQLI
ncbi:MAG: hypothetical protein LBS84_09510 [Clostridiales bacterium]|jgi:hypothetical protein|nr:hypothetical protein [Clostridiales bacterium]